MIVSLVAVFAAAAVCPGTPLAGRCFSGGNVGSTTVFAPAECCLACAANSSCAAWAAKPDAHVPAGKLFCVLKATLVAHGVPHDQVDDRVDKGVSGVRKFRVSHLFRLRTRSKSGQILSISAKIAQNACLHGCTRKSAQRMLQQRKPLIKPKSTKQTPPLHAKLLSRAKLRFCL